MSATATAIDGDVALLASLGGARYGREAEDAESRFVLVTHHRMRGPAT